MSEESSSSSDPYANTVVYEVNKENEVSCLSSNPLLFDGTYFFRAASMVTDPDEKLVWDSLSLRRHVMVSGEAGSGKSHLSKRFIATCQKYLEPDSYKICASTGVAAVNLGHGCTTLHSALSLGLAQGDASYLWEKITRCPGKFRKTLSFLRRTKVLFIDEVSMVTPAFFMKLSKLFQLASLNPVAKARPFANVLLYLSGDFTQLGPVISQFERQRYPYDHLFQTPVWSSLEKVRMFLNRNFRQEDGPYLQLLNRVRRGDLTETDRVLIRSLLNRELELGHVVPLKIRSYVNEVNPINTRELEAIESEKFHFLPVVYLRPPKGGVLTAATRSRFRKEMNDVKKMKKVFPVYAVTLKEGAQVMCKSNHYSEHGIVNGTCGKVVSVQKQIRHVVVDFVLSSGRVKRLTVSPVEFAVPKPGGVDLVLKQLPLCLAFAVTFHKSQGLTLPAISMSCRCFAAGQFYTGMSRVRSPNHITISDVSFVEEKAIITDEAAVEFEIGYLERLKSVE